MQHDRNDKKYRIKTKITVRARRRKVSYILEYVQGKDCICWKLLVYQVRSIPKLSDFHSLRVRLARRNEVSPYRRNCQDWMKSTIELTDRRIIFFELSRSSVVDICNKKAGDSEVAVGEIASTAFCYVVWKIN